ncbi:MAG: beta-ketoacyl-[acyl-carrier-protein] synthase family protein [Deltaproteobacteria bacterium]|nr:beta-ketoacyl-[acyl-carrier-protein] synthase family protein [Deltaproteobacteria bacterium]
MQRRRVVVTGMGINTALGDDLKTFYRNLIEGRSGISRWSYVKDDRVYSKVGGDLSQYDAQAKLTSFEGKIPAEVFKRTKKLFRGAPFSTRLSVLNALDGWLDAGLRFDHDPWRQTVLVGGHNLNERYLLENHNVFRTQDADYIDAQAALLDLDTDHAGSVGEVLGCRGAMYTLGGACASANVGMRSAMDEIRYHDHDIAVVTGATLDFSDMGLHAMALLGAITFQSFNDQPEKASRPYDTRREGFVPSHGTATLVLEEYEHAKARGAKMYGELLGVVATSDANHLPNPSRDGQAATIKKLFQVTGVRPEEVDFICAHATSTPLGDLSELGAIKDAFGAHAKKLKINAPKSMLGHTCWSAPAVETVGALLQMQHGRLHPSINIENLDPAVDLDVCANKPVDHQTRIFLKNSFGFGGLNVCAMWKKVD